MEYYPEPMQYPVYDQPRFVQPQYDQPQFVQPQMMMVPQPQYMMPNQQFVSAPYGCGSCSKKKFGNGRGSKPTVNPMVDPYKAMSNALAKHRISDPVLSGLKLSRERRTRRGFKNNRRGK
jgi:hypothetical protein